MGVPREPGFSCPQLDAAIEGIENARKIAIDLRTWGSYWEQRAGEIETEKDNEINEKNQEIARLEARISAFEEQVTDLREQLDNQLNAVGG